MTDKRRMTTPPLVGGMDKAKTIPVKGKVACLLGGLVCAASLTILIYCSRRYDNFPSADHSPCDYNNKYECMDHCNCGFCVPDSVMIKYVFIGEPTYLHQPPEYCSNVRYRDGCEGVFSTLYDAPECTELRVYNGWEGFLITLSIVSAWVFLGLGSWWVLNLIFSRPVYCNNVTLHE